MVKKLQASKDAAKKRAAAAAAAAAAYDDRDLSEDGEIADSSPAISALSARKGANHNSSLDWKELAIVAKNSKQPQVRNPTLVLDHVSLSIREGRVSNKVHQRSFIK